MNVTHKLLKCAKKSNIFLRNCSSVHTTSSLWNTEDLLPKEDFNKFVSFLPNVVNNLETHHLDLIPKVKEHFNEVLHYVVPFGKKLRSSLMLAALKSFEEEGLIKNLDVEFYYKISWLVEVSQGIIVTDDIVDDGKMRRGRPCWHTLDNIGMKAISDGFLMDRIALETVKKLSLNHPSYHGIRYLYQDVCKNTLIGQVLDGFLMGDRSMDFHTMENFKKLATCKTSSYSFHWPLKYAVLVANINHDGLTKPLDEFCDEMGIFYQVQNDVWDIYAPTGLTGKEGTDIQTRQCTWLSVKAMEDGNDAQRKIMKQCYGTEDPEAVAAVRNVYDELGLREKYQSYQQEAKNKVHDCISKIPLIPHDLLYRLVDSVFNKSK